MQAAEMPIPVSIKIHFLRIALLAAPLLANAQAYPEYGRSGGARSASSRDPISAEAGMLLILILVLP